MLPVYLTPYPLSKSKDLARGKAEYKIVLKKCLAQELRK